MTNSTLGIDVSKATLDVALLSGDDYTSRSFTNDSDGIRRLFRFLKKSDARGCRVVLEATGRYGDLIAHKAHDRGYPVYVVNPARIKLYAASNLKRVKTDALDARVIAHFGSTQEMTLWSPPTLSQVNLQAMTRHLTTLKQARTREMNRLQAGVTSKVVLDSLNRHISFLNEQIQALENEIDQHIDKDPDMKEQRELIESITGIGSVTAAQFIAEIPDVTRYDSAQQLAAHAGLTPYIKQSGKSGSGQAHIAKIGNRRLQAMLFLPALSAKRWNPLVQELVARLKKRGKHKLVIVTAVMRKLLHIIYGVLKHKQPFDPNYTVNVQVAS